MSNPTSPSNTEPNALPSELRNKFAAVRQWQFISRATTAVALLAVGGLFYNFYTSTRAGVEANFSPEKTRAAAQEALPKVTPLLAQAAQTVYADAAPVYSRLAAERYQRVRDEIGTAALIRLKNLPDQAGKQLGVRLGNSFDRVLKRVEPDLKAAFPSLTDAQRRDLLITYFHDAIDARNQTLALKVDAIHVNERNRVLAVLEKFQLPADENAGSTDQLSKELVRSMLLLAQQHIEELTNPGGTPNTPGTAKGIGGTPALTDLPRN